MTARSVLACALLAYALPVHAQTPAPANPPSRLELLSRAAFHMGAQHLSGSDKRYVWDANFGGDIDLVSYGATHATFEANYQVVLGEEIRHFDPNQGNYMLAGVLGTKVRGIDTALVFYHQSRHLADRPKVSSVDWNMLGGRVARTGTVGPVGLSGRVDLRGVLRRSFVDYTWEIDSAVRARYPLRPALSLVGSSGVRVLGTTGEHNRGTQTGVREEGGVRIEGRGAAVELFLAFERRIDPYPLELGSASWFGGGFHLMSR